MTTFLYCLATAVVVAIVDYLYVNRQARTHHQKLAHSINVLHDKQGLWVEGFTTGCPTCGEACRAIALAAQTMKEAHEKPK